MELKNLKAEAALIDVPLVYDDEGKATDGFKVAGHDSKQYQDADREWRLQSVRRSASRGTQMNAATEAGAAELVDLMPKREMLICMACIVEIYGFTIGDEPAPLNEETLKMIFGAKPSWRTKVVNAIEADRVFTKS